MVYILYLTDIESKSGQWSISERKEEEVWKLEGSGGHSKDDGNDRGGGRGSGEGFSSPWSMSTRR